MDFDTATKIKLHILREYIKDWLLVFLQKKEKFWKDIYIYDFFAGEGYDDHGTPGSPIIIIEELKAHFEAIKKEKINLTVLLNDIDRQKIKKLKGFIDEDNLPYELQFKTEDFTKLFEAIYSEMISGKNSYLPRFMFLDQFGIKFVTPSIFNKITQLRRTDFIFFISSSYFKRFAEQKEFQQYLRINKKEFDGERPYHCHRVIFDYYLSHLPNKEYYLAPFSLRKESGNVYGLIFGSNHLLGIEKFMNISWRLDGVAGEANFNIDDDPVEGSTLDMFSPDPRPKKLQSLERNLHDKIKSGSITTLSEAYQYTYSFGCLPKHANNILNELKKSNLVDKTLKLRSRNIHRINSNVKLKA